LEADPSRVLETWTLAQALPPLGRALDMRDSHPASMDAAEMQSLEKRGKFV
jgi:hypothetical protein